MTDHKEAVKLKEADQLAVKHRATDLGMERRSEYRTYAMNTAELAALIAEVRRQAMEEGK